MALSVLDSLCELVDFAREQGGEERPRLRAAIKRAEVKIASLRRQHTAHAARHCCPICRANCSGIVCWRCWQSAPWELRVLVKNAQSEAGRKTADLEILHWARKEAA